MQSAASTSQQRRPQRANSSSGDGGEGIDSSGNPPRARRRSSLIAAGTRRKNSNTSIGNAINQVLGNDTSSPHSDELGLLSSDEDDMEDAPPSLRRARTNSNAARSSASINDVDNDDEYHEESFSGPMHYVRPFDWPRRRPRRSLR